MRLKKILIVLALVLTLSPILAVVGSTQQGVPVQLMDYNDTVNVQAGTTIKYDIDTLTLPPMDNLTIGNMADNQLYVKVTDVELEHEYEPIVIGPLVYFGIGIIFTKDTTVTVGEGFTALDVIVPAGSATPAMVVDGVPHFNVSSYYSPALFFLDNGWTEHESILEYMGFTVSNTADTLTAEWSNATGLVSFAWRKSDGILTYLHIKNANFSNQAFVDTEIELSLNSVEIKGLALTVGQVIELNAEIAYLNVDVTGDLIPTDNLTDISSMEDEIADMQDQTIMKFVITDIEGLYYTAQTYLYDMETNSLLEQPKETLFIGFLGAIQISDVPIDGTYETMPFFAPAITTDYDIYTGYMVLANTLVGVYLDDFLSFIPELSSSGIAVNNIDGTFSVLEKRGYFFLKESLTLDVDVDIAISLVKATDPSIIVDVSATQEGWMAYSDTGILAGMRMQTSIDLSVNTDMSTFSGISTGQVVINFDFKLVNPNYNPPDPMGGGIIPGFTWFIAIPAIFAIATTSVILHRRK
ncbi:MAG: hypothetical protein ACTSXO_11130 [Candidatus Heimdallarchaeota archaeon]